MKFRTRANWAFCALFFSCSGFCESLSQNFSSDVDKDSGNLIWNIESEQIHPPIKVWGWIALGGANGDTALGVGDGSDGVFDSSTYQDFSQNGNVSGNTITINTNTYPQLNVTSFILENTWTLITTGDKPLVIRSLGVVSISGTIDCAGEDGTDANTDNTIRSAGGQGRCAGGDGGDGSFISGSVSIAAQDGTAGGNSVSGGVAGSGTGAGGGAGGGGGGSYVDGAGNIPSSGDNASGTGGAAGGILTDHGFSEIGGGSGGGGAALYNEVADGANHASGGAGGGGGGVVLIYAMADVFVTATGVINVNGGDGGGTARKAGSGGGGGGGSIAIFSYTNIDFQAAASVSAILGDQGTSAGGDGGDGGDGRTWVTDRDAVLTGGGSENPVGFFTNFGVVSYDEGQFESESIVVDLLGSFPTISSFSLSRSQGIGNSIQVEVQTSKFDDFQSVGSLWNEVSGLVDAEIFRYLRFRVSMDVTDKDKNSHLNSFRIEYENGLQDEFDFSSSCGSVKSSDGTSFGILFFCLPFLLLIIFRIRWTELQSQKVPDRSCH